MNITFTDRLGRTYRASCHDEATARQRLALLDGQEASTERDAPTDSGSVRFNCNAERAAIRAAFPNL